MNGPVDGAASRQSASTAMQHEVERATSMAVEVREMAKALRAKLLGPRRDPSSGLGEPRVMEDGPTNATEPAESLGLFEDTTMSARDAVKLLAATTADLKTVLTEL